MHSFFSGKKVEDPAEKEVYESAALFLAAAR